MEASPNGESISASEVNKEKLASSMIHGLNFQHRQHAESKFSQKSILKVFWPESKLKVNYSNNERINEGSKKHKINQQP